MSKIVRRKSAQLGMSYGKTMYRLRKQIMFRLICRLDENICFKCDKRIVTADELSIEHKIPWLDNDTELFWDLDNTTFSHCRCNKPHRHKIWNREDPLIPAGSAHCYICKSIKQTKYFYRDKTRVRSACRECTRI